MKPKWPRGKLEIASLNEKMNEFAVGKPPRLAEAHDTELPLGWASRDNAEVEHRAGLQEWLRKGGH